MQLCRTSPAAFAGIQQRRLNHSRDAPSGPSTKQRLPQEDDLASSACIAADVTNREIDEECGAKTDADPGLASLPRNSKEERGRQQKQEEISERIEDQHSVRIQSALQFWQQVERKLTMGLGVWMAVAGH